VKIFQSDGIFFITGQDKYQYSNSLNEAEFNDFLHKTRGGYSNIVELDELAKYVDVGTVYRGSKD
jgi:hypothetical protein